MSRKTGGDPGFTFWKDDFLGSPLVQAMTVAEVGAYVLLLLAAQDGGIQNDQPMLARLTRMGNHWTRHKDVVLSRFWLGLDGLLYHPKVEAMRYERAEFTKKKAAAGRVGGAKSASRSNFTNSPNVRSASLPLSQPQVVAALQNRSSKRERMLQANGKPPSPIEKGPSRAPFLLGADTTHQDSSEGAEPGLSGSNGQRPGSPATDDFGPTDEDWDAVEERLAAKLKGVPQ